MGAGGRGRVKRLLALSLRKGCKVCKDVGFLPPEIFPRKDCSHHRALKQEVHERARVLTCTHTQSFLPKEFRVQLQDLPTLTKMFLNLQDRHRAVW